MAFSHGPTWWSNFSRKLIYKAFGPLIKCKPNVDQEEWPCTKIECVEFFRICTKHEVLEEKKFKFDHYLVFSCLHLLFPKTNSLKVDYTIISLPWVLAFLYWSTSFASSTTKPVGPSSMDNVGFKIMFWGTPNSMVTLALFSLV